MVRKAAFAAALALMLSLALGSAGPSAAPAGPIKLARNPDYHAGKIAFSYLGDIWTANEDGTGAQRLTDNTARETFPRFSPDGRWIAFSSESLRQQRRVRRPDDGRRAEAADVSLRQRRSRRLDARLAAGALPRVARRRRVSGRRDALPDSRRRRTGEAAAGGLGLLGHVLARRQDSSRSIAIRRCGRASTIAAATRRTSGSPT